MPIIVLLFITTVIYAGIKIYFAQHDLNINPSATTYARPIKSEFDTEIIEKLKTEQENLPVQPEDFRKLSQND